MVPFRIESAARQKLLAFIRGGGHPEAAAVAVGLDVKVFRDAMRLGKSSDKRGARYIFMKEVEQAWAIARLAGDVKMYREKPIEWLKNGPGQALVIGRWRLLGGPGQKKDPTKHAGGNLEAVGEFLAWCLEGLEPFPEARKALGDRVAQTAMTKQLGKKPRKRK